MRRRLKQARILSHLNRLLKANKSKQKLELPKQEKTKKNGTTTPSFADWLHLQLK